MDIQECVSQEWQGYPPVLSRTLQLVAASELEQLVFMWDASVMRGRLTHWAPTPPHLTSGLLKMSSLRSAWIDALRALVYALCENVTILPLILLGTGLFSINISRNPLCC